MVHNDDFSRAEELLRDDDGPQSVSGSTPGVADHMGRPQLDPQRLGRVQTGVHARYHGDLATCQHNENLVSLFKLLFVVRT